MMSNLLVCLLLGAASAFNAPVSMIGQRSIAQTSAAAPVYRAAVVRMSDDVEEKVKGIIAEQLGVEASAVVPGASFTEDLGADSLDAVELIMAIEEVRAHIPISFIAHTLSAELTL